VFKESEPAELGVTWNQADADCCLWELEPQVVLGSPASVVNAPVDWLTEIVAEVRVVAFAMGSFEGETGNSIALESPPPGAGFETDTAAVPAAATSAAPIDAI
jgi:hypothetical protein